MQVASGAAGDFADLQALGARATFYSQKLRKCQGSLDFVLSHEPRLVLSFSALEGKKRKKTAAW